MIRKFIRSDLRAAANMMVEVYRDPPWHDIWTEKSAMLYLTEIFKCPTFLGFVMEEEGIMAAVAIGRYKTWYDGVHFILEEFFVDKTMQRQGVGSRLMDFLKGYWIGQNIKKVELYTGRGYPAEGFYSNQGFVRTITKSNMELTTR